MIGHLLKDKLLSMEKHQWISPLLQLFSTNFIPVELRLPSVVFSLIFASFGRPWEFLKRGSKAETPEETSMGWNIRDELGISNCNLSVLVRVLLWSDVVETYKDMKESSELHCALSLYLIAKHAGIIGDDAHLIKTISDVVFHSFV